MLTLFKRFSNANGFADPNALGRELRGEDFQFPPQKTAAQIRAERGLTDLELEALPSCGLVAQPTDEIARLGLIAIRYRALICEALVYHCISSRGELDGRRMHALHGGLDIIEHLAQDLLEPHAGSDVSAVLASELMDTATGMRYLLLTFGADLKDSRLTVPSMSDLRNLYTVCERLGGRPRMLPPFNSMHLEFSGVVRGAVAA